MSFLEMLDVVNEGLIRKGEDPIAFDSDCREGICGACGFLINGVPHGPDPGTTVCQLHMRRFKDGETHRARALAGEGLPADQGPRRRSQRVRSDHPGRRLHVGQRGRRAGRQRHPHPEGHRRAGHGFGRVHRLRRLRGGVQERVSRALHVREDQLTSRCCPRVRPSAAAASWRWSTVTTPRGSAAVRTKASARRSARRRSAITNIARMNREYPMQGDASSCRARGSSLVARRTKDPRGSSSDERRATNHGSEAFRL